jgi:Antibiotic biosynthesis monooxygenase
MAPITTIVHFEVPTDNVDRFFAFWQDSIQDKVGKQPGLIDGIFHRGIDSDGPFQFINVARWDSAEQLEAALQATREELHQEGVEMGKVFHDLGVKVSQNNYVEAVRYTASPVPIPPE